MRVYDLVMTHKLDADDLFIHCVQKHCAEARMNFFLVEPLWVEQFLREWERGAVTAKVLLNMHSEHHQPDEVFHRLVRLAGERQTKVINPLDKTLAAFDKAAMHGRLLAAGIHVPYTVVVPPERLAGFRLEESERQALGRPFVIKPAMGYGRRGVLLDATSEADLARSAAAWPNDAYLLQRLIVPRQVNGWPAYYRVYYVFGSTWTCWWNCYTDTYRLVSAQELQDLPLWLLEALAHRIADISGMSFFSSEVALTDSGEFVVIDYVNDQCHMLSQTANPQIGVPDGLVASIAQRLVQGARELIRA
jgi:hypothetical protein